MIDNETRRRWEAQNSIVIILIGIVFVIATWVNIGCAHTCLAPEDRAAKFGTVLECKDVPGEPKTRCLISTPDGDVTHFFKACE